MYFPNKVTIIEVGPRDGLQNEKNIIPTDIKIKFIHKLKEAGIKEMELTSFVSPEWVPQMKDANQVLQACLDPATRDLVLTPNRKGIDLLYETACKAVAVVVGVSETFNKKNINKTPAESIKELTPIILDLKEKNYFVRACISTAFYCPYEGKMDETDVLSLCQKFVALGVDELCVADTIGMANPKEVYSLFSKLKKAFPNVLLTGHFHDTRGMALANIFSALQVGISRFDTSAGGLGGCPFAPGASGNIATEDVVYMVEKMGIKTDVNLAVLKEAVDIIKPYLSRPIDSKNYKLADGNH